jgi:hypothetical protein
VLNELPGYETSYPGAKLVAGNRPLSFSDGRFVGRAVSRVGRQRSLRLRRKFRATETFGILVRPGVDLMKQFRPKFTDESQFGKI